MSTGLIHIMLLVALVLLALGTWLSNEGWADAMFTFAAFSIGGIWAKHTMPAIKPQD
ncbi:MAG: hypothetical protein ABJ327_03350 [Litoreibacter sp.]